MFRTLAALAATLLFATSAAAQSEGAALSPGSAGTRSLLQGCVYRLTPIVATDGQQMGVNCDASGNMVVSGGSGTGVSAQQVQGSSASGVADVGNPVKVGGVYNSGLGAQTAGTRGDLQLDARYNQRITLCGLDQASTTCLTSQGLTADAVTQNRNTVPVEARGMIYNGASFDRWRSVQGSDGTGLGVGAVAIAPQSNANGAIVPVVTSAVASNLVVKAGPGNLYSWRVTAGASAGFVMVFNATSAPVDGPVTPLDCIPVAANAEVGRGTIDIPERYSTGITIVFSTTGCFSKTASATAFIRAVAQ